MKLKESSDLDLVTEPWLKNPFNISRCKQDIVLHSNSSELLGEQIILALEACLKCKIISVMVCVLFYTL